MLTTDLIYTFKNKIYPRSFVNMEKNIMDQHVELIGLDPSLNALQ